MKKILLFASALAGLFFAASCQQENLDPQQMAGAVKFTVEAPGAIATKAIADGQNVNEVHYEVYKNVAGVDHALLNPDSEPMAKGVVAMENKKANITLDLLQDQEYTVIFWAQVAGAGHYDTSDLRCIELAQNHQVDANDESRAAFFKRFDFSTYEHKDYANIVLVRPFAQLNLLTTMESLKPVQSGQTAGYEIDAKESEIIVTGLAASFNTVTGVGNYVDYPFTFNMAATPEEQGQATLTVNGTDYHYVSMNYMFVPIDSEDGAATVNLEYEIITDKGSIKHEIANVPLRENYRTNVIGNLFTKESKFEIVVDAEFEVPENVVGEEWSQSGNYEYTVNAGAPATTLKAILDHANAAAKVAATKAEGPVVKINLAENVEWETGAGIGSTPLLPEDSPISAVVINGNGKTFTATGAGVGQIRLANGGKLTFNNVKIVDESVSYAENSWEYGYLEFGGVIRLENCEVVNAIMVSGETAAFKNCSFNSNKDNEYDVWVDNGSAFFTECTFAGARGLKVHEAYGSEVVKVAVESCSFGPLSKKPGVAMGDLNAGTTITIKNSLFNRCQPGDQDLYIYETDTDVTTFTFETDNNVIIPSGDANVELADGTIIVATATGLKKAIKSAKDGAKIQLADGVYEGVFFVEGKNLTIEAYIAGKATINGKLGVAASGKTVNVKNIVFENSFAGSVATGNQFVDKTGKYCIGLYCASVNVEGCTFNLSDNGGINFYAINDPEYCTVKSSTFNCNGFRPILSKVNVTVDGCTFNDQYKYALQVWGNQNNGEKVIFTNNIINEAGKTSGCADAYKSYVSVSKSYPLSNVAFTITGNTPGYNFVYDNHANVDITSCTLNGNQIVAGQCFTPAGVDDVKEVVMDYTEGAVYVGPADVQTVINNAAAKTVIRLTPGEYGTIVAKSNITILGTTNAVVGCVHLNASDNVTLKNIKFDAARAQQIYHKKGTAYGYANILTATKDNNPNKGVWGLVVDGCTFTGDFNNNGSAIGFVDQNRGSGQSRDITIKNCKFESTNSLYHIYGYYFGGDVLNIENNLFETGAYKTIYLGRYQSSVPVVVKDNTFKACTTLDEAMTLQDHGNYGVSVDASNNTFAN